MIEILFYYPTDPTAANRLAAMVAHLASLGLKGTIRPSIAIRSGECDTDALAVSDITDVQHGRKAPPYGTPSDWLLWSFHRNTPTWGTPLVDLEANEIVDRMYLKVRLVEPSAEEGVAQQWLLCPSRRSLHEMRAEWDEITTLGGVDFWLRREADGLRAVIVHAGK